MSDLAPFVAAALRDKTIHELMEENKKLRERVRASMTVEVTGPEGQPVYARGQFDEDGKYHGNPNLWDVTFTEQLHPCPLSELRNIEIWIGGTLRATFVERGFSKVSPIWDYGDYDNDGGNRHKPRKQKEKIFCACFQPGAVWFNFNIGWTDEELDALNLHFPNHHEVEPEEILDHICEILGQADPRKVCKFKSISPAVAEIRKMVESVPGATSPQTLARNERSRAASEKWTSVMIALGEVLGNYWRDMRGNDKVKMSIMYGMSMEEDGIDLQDREAVLDYLHNCFGRHEDE